MYGREGRGGRVGVRDAACAVAWVAGAGVLRLNSFYAGHDPPMKAVVMTSGTPDTVAGQPWSMVPLQGMKHTPIMGGNENGHGTFSETFSKE